MTIGADALIGFWGAQTAGLGTTTTGFAADALSDGTNDLVAWTNVDDAPWASFTLKIDWNTTAPDPGGHINLFARKTAVEGSNNDDIPTANFPHFYIGRFKIKDVLTEQFITEVFQLPNWKSQSIYHFYLQNKTTETMEDGYDLYVTPETVGPHA